MYNLVIHICTICGRQKTKSGWFLIAENQWQDKLNILEWNDSLAWKKGVHEVCCVEHALELIAHWMRTDTLNYPLGRSTARPTSHSSVVKWDLDNAGARQLCELFVHRESLEENLASFTVILDALSAALRSEATEAEITQPLQCDSNLWREPSLVL